MSALDKYLEINGSYRKVCVFRIGIDAGFFTELHYMIFTILYCLENRIKFKLYSKNANFGYNLGWKDYFLDFCEEVYDKYHSYLNRHPTYLSMKDIWDSRNFQLFKWKIKNDGMLFVADIYKKYFLKNSLSYYTQDVFFVDEKLNKHYDIPGFFEGDYIGAYNKIVDIVWRFKEDIAEEIATLIRHMNLPTEFVGCQIRGGDKFIEYDLLSVDIYLSKIRKVTDLKDVFVLTDDYGIVEQLRSKAPTYNWYTLCDESQRGYYNSSFAKLDITKKQRQMVMLFASMEVLMKSTVFIGTITAKPSIFLGIRKYPQAYWVDFENANFYDSIDYSMSYKRRLVKKFFEKNV